MFGQWEVLAGNSPPSHLSHINTVIFSTVQERVSLPLRILFSLSNPFLHLPQLDSSLSTSQPSTWLVGDASSDGYHLRHKIGDASCPCYHFYDFPGDNSFELISLSKCRVKPTCESTCLFSFPFHSIKLSSLTLLLPS